MDQPVTPPTRSDLSRYFLRLGALGFGGPIALVGYMHRDLVEARGWFTEEEYREGIALAQLSPGPWPPNSAFTSATSVAGARARRSLDSPSSCPAS